MKLPPTPVMSRHQFLARLHEALAPVEIYLEVGVQTGASLALAEEAGVAYGVDPTPDVHGHNVRPNQRVIVETSDAWLGCKTCERPTVDLGLIDGSHLMEDALRDFIYIERHSRPTTVVMFGGVLPYSQDNAWRHQPPGDGNWTGDVFKLMTVLVSHRPDLNQHLVDVSPAGALVVTGLDSRNVVLEKRYDDIAAEWLPRHHVPDAILAREGAQQPDDVLATITADLDRIKKGVRA
jgi:hypothetical protein